MIVDCDVYVLTDLSLGGLLSNPMSSMVILLADVWLRPLRSLRTNSQANSARRLLPAQTDTAMTTFIQESIPPGAVESAPVVALVVGCAGSIVTGTYG